MMTSAMKEAFGYDALGNCERLVCLDDRIEMEKGIRRAAGMVVCDHCGCTFNMHPPVQGALWATRTCMDGIVKL